MIIPPPKDDDDTLIIPFMDEEAEFTEEQYNYIKELISRKPWICGICGCKNANDNKRCVYCYIRNGVITVKP